MRSVAILSLPFEGQEAWLLQLGQGNANHVDELALEFSDHFVLASQFLDEQWMNREAFDRMAELDALLLELSGNKVPGFWTLDGLRTSVDWDRVRESALTALLAL